MDEKTKRLRDLKNRLVETPDLLNLVPAEPEKPLPSDCCGQSCVPCVFDLYYGERDLWIDECNRILGNKTDSDLDLTEHSKTISDHIYAGNSDVGSDNNEGIESELNVAYVVPNRYCGFRLATITKISVDTNVYKFELPVKRGSLNISAGQHLILKCLSKESRPISRQYTPIFVHKSRGYFEVLIKLYTHGRMSDCIRKWQIGETVFWRGPFGSFKYKLNEHNILLMFAAGTGIAPFVDIVEQILNNEADDTRIVLIYSCQKYDQILLKNDISSWKQFWNFKCTYMLSKEKNTSCARYGESILFKKIDLDSIRELLRETQGLSYKVLICGTKSFNKDVVKWSCWIEQNRTVSQSDRSGTASTGVVRRRTSPDYGCAPPLTGAVQLAKRFGPQISTYLVHAVS